MRLYFYFYIAFVLASQRQPSANPALLNLPANTWYSVPNTRLNASPVATNNYLSSTDYDKIRATGGIAMIMHAWSGGVYDLKRDRLIIWGGGHMDYWGNEVYAFDVATLTWIRLHDACLNPNPDNGLNADGTPNSRHTYGNIGYIGHVDKMLSKGGALAGPNAWGPNQNMTWLFDFATQKWSSRAQASGANWSPSHSCGTAYDPVTKKLWWGEGSSSNGWGLYAYDYDANAYENHNSDYTWSWGWAVDTKRGILVGAGGGYFSAYDIRSGSKAVNLNWTTTGGSAFIAKNYPGFEYDPVADKFVGWAGDAIYVLDPVTKTWSVNNPSGAPTGYGTTGIFGRFRYSPSVNAFVVASGVSENVHFYKLTAGTGAERRAPAAVAWDVRLGPNPFLSSLSIVLPGAFKDARLFIVDSRGREVSRLWAGEGCLTLKTDGMAKGIYTLKIVSVAETLTKRIVKI